VPVLEHSPDSTVFKIFLKKANLCKGPETLFARDKWHDVLPENSWDVISLLATCHKQGGDEGGERRTGRVGCLSFSLYFSRFIFLMKYLEIRLFKLRIVFTFEIIASRSSKLDPY
jgi:hypothetical protein